jgi:hypothetical protein
MKEKEGDRSGQEGPLEPSSELTKSLPFWKVAKIACSRHSQALVPPPCSVASWGLPQDRVTMLFTANQGPEGAASFRQSAPSPCRSC